MDAAEVGLAVADAEGKVVDVGDAGARVGVGALGEWHVLVGGGAMALIPGLADRGRQLAAVRVIHVRTVVVAVQDRELGAVDRAQVLDRHPQHHRHHNVNLRLSITTILCTTQWRVRGPLRTDRMLVITLQNRSISRERLIPALGPQVCVSVSEAIEAESSEYYLWCEKVCFIEVWKTFEVLVDDIVAGTCADLKIC